MRLQLTCRCLAIITVLFMSTRIAVAADAPARVTIDLKRNWEPLVMSTMPEGAADNASMDLAGEGAAFPPHEAGPIGTFEYDFDIGVDSAAYPILVLKYRAKNLDTARELPGLWIDDFFPRRYMKPAIVLKEFTADGEVHE